MLMRLLLTLFTTAAFSLSAHADSAVSDDMWDAAGDDLYAMDTEGDDPWANMDWDDEDAWDALFEDADNWGAEQEEEEGIDIGDLALSQVGGTPIDINTATVEALGKLIGIGPARAQAIVEYREANGPFASIDELAEISGISEALVELNREAMMVG